MLAEHKMVLNIETSMFLFLFTRCEGFGFWLVNLCEIKLKSKNELFMKYPIFMFSSGPATLFTRCEQPPQGFGCLFFLNLASPPLATAELSLISYT